MPCPRNSPLIEKMLRLCTLAGLIAAAHADGPRRFLQSTTCVDGVVDKTGLPCTVCDGESAEDYCNCHTDCELKPPDEDAKFCACPEAQACCECRDSDAWKKTDSDLGCAWVAEYPGVPGDWKRCRAKGTIDGALGKVFASYACPAACSTPCHDDPTWHVKNDPTKNCAWVSRYPEVRCDLQSGAEEPTFARDDCPAACASQSASKPFISTAPRP